MATTSIWRIKGWIGDVLIYAENPDKTTNPKSYEAENMSQEKLQALSDVLDYAMQDKKTLKEMNVTHNDDEVLEQFVSGVNCLPSTARDEMQAVKKQFGKEDGVVAYHGYQSFAEGEVTPEIAHEIGVKLAERLWGERHQVLVTTHLDKASHIHNHFVVNNVSFTDGKKYRRTKKDYADMRRESDRLCKEYGLSVVKNPKSKGMHYAEWRDEQQGKPTLRTLLKQDVDKALSKAMTDKQFFFLLRQMGYEIKMGKDITIKPKGRERGLKLQRNFGESYSYENICKRIIQNEYDRRMKPAEKLIRIRIRLFGQVQKGKRKIGGLRGLYYHYCYLLGIFPKKRRTQSYAEVNRLFREDLLKLDNISKESKLLCRYRIETKEQLVLYREGVAERKNEMAEERNKLRNKLRSLKDRPEKEQIKQQISALSREIETCRQEENLCKDIESRSSGMQEKLQTYKLQKQEKEIDKNESRSRRK